MSAWDAAASPRRLRTLLRAIVETTRHPLLVLDAGARVIAANPAFHRAFATTDEVTIGVLAYEIAGARLDTPLLRRLIEEVTAHPETFEVLEIEVDDGAGGCRTLLASGRHVAPGGAAGPLILLALEDVTGQRHADAELRRLNLELEARVGERTAQLLAANRELEAFSYSVSHDLRSPLRAIAGFSDELLRRHADSLDERGMHYLTRVKAASQRMAELIDDLLDLSRLSRDVMARESVDLSAMAAEVGAELEQRHAGRAVSLTIDPGLCAHGDPRLLRLAVENLLDNAWKFTANNASATIRFGREDAGGRSAFFARDDGAGFDLERAGNLFGAFQRLHSAQDFPGNGIGLATVRRVVHRHGGEVWAESAVGAGATFYFTLPAAVETA